MSLTEPKLNWTDLQPNLIESDVPDKSVCLLDLQPKVKTAIHQFLQNSHRSLLVLKADSVLDYASAVENFIKLQQAPLSLSGVQYIVEQADSFSFAQVSALPAQSFEDNFAAKQIVATALYFDQATLFGAIRIHPTSHDIQLNAGLVHQLNQGVLILSLSHLLAQFDCWSRLKQILLERRFTWYSTHPFKALPCEIPSYDLSLKVVLLGSREEIATFEEWEKQLYQMADYAEIENYISLQEPDQQIVWQQYVQSFAKQHVLPNLTAEGMNKLYQLFVRESESRILINISPPLLKNVLSETQQIAQGKLALSAVDFEAFFQQKSAQYGFLKEQAYSDILYNQVYVETEGEAIGQINGLSVVEFAGTPLSFGEPSRISCIVQFGDGEVIDIERKSELAGNLHSKGMMIVESCLSNLLDLPSQLPFSASLVFEQSYAEIDGDSASLAAFLALVSALSELNIPQSIAVTGTIDQFGIVHAVGGVNDKVEGFFAICKARGLTGKQGVIIPDTTCYQLSLSDEVVSAVKNNQFSIWAVSDVFDACEILFERKLEQAETSSDELSIAQLINQRIESRSEQQHSSFWSKWLNKK
ncbi:AAA family ATPase [Pasteurellaceae bacterium 22721_9_1]